MPQTPDAIIDHLRYRIAQRAPGSVLVICERAEKADRLCASLDVSPRLVHAHPENAFSLLNAEDRYDLAIVADTLETRPHKESERLLGRIRDMKAGGVLVAVSHDMAAERGHGPWRTQQFIALGFRRCADSRGLTPGWGLYRYDIHDYKTTPSWLNSRHWANPERWDKERW